MQYCWKLHEDIWNWSWAGIDWFLIMLHECKIVTHIRGFGRRWARMILFYIDLDVLSTIRFKKMKIVNSSTSVCISQRKWHRKLTVIAKCAIDVYANTFCDIKKNQPNKSWGDKCIQQSKHHPSSPTKIKYRHVTRTTLELRTMDMSKATELLLTGRANKQKYKLI